MMIPMVQNVSPDRCGQEMGIDPKKFNLLAPFTFLKKDYLPIFIHDSPMLGSSERVVTPIHKTMLPSSGRQLKSTYSNLFMPLQRTQTNLLK